MSPSGKVILGFEKEALHMEDERDDIVILVDENGEEVEFEHIDTIEMNGNEYVVLAPLLYAAH